MIKLSTNNPLSEDEWKMLQGTETATSMIKNALVVADVRRHHMETDDEEVVESALEQLQQEPMGLMYTTRQYPSGRKFYFESAIDVDKFIKFLTSSGKNKVKII
jgi:menaquinone-dependent protoporphyrinogen IX oxidase